MNLQTDVIIGAVVVGLGATVVMDLWNLFLLRAFDVRSLDYCLLGRWVCHLPRGTFRHPNISVASRVPFECAVGWVAHYTIGITMALMFVALVSGEWLVRPSLLPALLFGIATVVFPFFLLQPALGFGIAASKTPKPMQARLKSLGTHTVFGLGMYLSALGAERLL